MHAYIHREDSLRSIVISQRLLGTREIAVFRHTDCGMTKVNPDELRQIIKSSNPDDHRVQSWAEQAEFLEFSDPVEQVKKDVDFLKQHPYDFF